MTGDGTQDQKALWNSDHNAGKHATWRDVTRQLAAEVAGEIKSGSKLLELGCGVGSDARFFANMGVRVTATDFSTEVISQDKELGENENLSFELLDLTEEFPYSDASFDVVYAYLSLHYFNDSTTRQIFNEIARVLVPKGRLYFACKSSKDPKYGEGEEIGPDIFIRKGHIRHFFTEEYAHQMVDPKFQVTKIYETNFKAFGEESAFINCWAEKK